MIEMPKYKIEVEFDSEVELPAEALDWVGANMEVQLEGLSDGDLEENGILPEDQGTFKYKHVNTNWKKI